MQTQIPGASSPITRQPVHHSITEEQISRLVDTFYTGIQADVRLGPIFNHRVHGEWSPHLERMKEFWRSVLMRTGEYKGRPLPIHVAIEEMEPEDFGRWLTIFRPVVRDCFENDAADIVIEMAERIAQSLWLGKFASTPLDRPPVWSEAEIANKP